MMRDIYTFPLEEGTDPRQMLSEIRMLLEERRYFIDNLYVNNGDVVYRGTHLDPATLSLIEVNCRIDMEKGIQKQ